MEKRIAQLETKLESVATDMADVKISLKDIASSLKTLAVLEVKHANTSEALKRAFERLDKYDERLLSIEKKMPKIALASSWVFAGVLGVISILGTLATAVLLRQIVGM